MVKGVEQGADPMPGSTGSAQFCASSMAMWALLVAIAISYGSLIPFDFASPVARAGDVWHTCLPTWDLGGLGDTTTNILIYIPLAWLLTSSLKKRGSSSVEATLLPIFACLILSIGLEWTQVYLHSRIATWWDVVTNTTGAVSGTVLALLSRPRAMMLIQSQFSWVKRNLAIVAAAVLTVAGIIANFVPGDLIVSTGGLRNAFLRADWSFTLSIPNRLDEAFVTRQMDSLGELAWFILLGFVSFRAFRPGHPSASVPMLKVLQHVTIVAILIELLQLFASGFVFSMSDMMIRWVGGILGVVLAVLVSECHAGDRTGRKSHGRVPLEWYGILVCLTAGGFLGALIWGRISGLLAPGALRFRGYPFVDLWQDPTAIASITGLATIVQYGILCGVIRSLSRRAGLGYPGFVAFVLVVCWAVATEVFTAMMTDGAVNTTTPVLAVISAVGVGAYFVGGSSQGDHAPNRLR